jgi:hypothetical protein
MADHAPSPEPRGFEDHKATYEGFLQFSTAGALVCLFVVVALVGFRFVNNPLNIFMGFGGILVGLISSLLALRMGGKWMIPTVLLILNILFVAANVHLS